MSDSSGADDRNDDADTTEVQLAAAEQQKPIAFFVKADDQSLPSDYGFDIKRSVLRAVLAADVSRHCEFQTYWGSLMLPSFRYSSATSLPHGDTAMDVDPFLYWSSAYDLHRSVQSGWNTLGTHTPWILGTASIYIGLLSRLPEGVSPAVDRHLRENRWYLGATIVDLASTLHREVFSLVPGWRYSCGAVDQPGADATPAAELFKGINVRGFDLHEHPIPEGKCTISWSTPAEESGRAVEFDTLTSKTGATYEESIVAEIVHRHEQDERGLAFTTGRRQPSADDLRGKLHDYALDPDHPAGGPKAIFFKRALGFERKDWKLLAIQLISNLQSSLPAKFRDNPGHGAKQRLQFEFEAEIVGLNGKRKKVVASWKIEDDEPAKLVTLTPGKKGTGPADVDEVPDGNWERLYLIARAVAEQAMRDCRPTPMALGGAGGTDVVPEGAHGSAWVQFPDARTGLVRWLLKAKYATKSQPGAYIMAPSDFLQPAEEWAEAMATVFQAAGHHCSVSQEID